jgi:hypothetical protein
VTLAYWHARSESSRPQREWFGGYA